MDSWQVLNQLKTIIQALVWSDGEKVFRQADITPLSDEGILRSRFLPTVALSLGDFRSGESKSFDRKSEILQQIRIKVAIDVQGDQLASASIMGKDRGNGSGGRGLLEVQAKILEAVSYLTSINAVNFHLLNAGSEQADHLDNGTNILLLTYLFEARLTQQRDYPAPDRLRFSGNVSLTWSIPPSRFDRKKIVLRRSSIGGSAPQLITEGTGVTLATDLATSVTDGALSAGTYWYSVFCQYDDLGAGVSANYNNSPPYSWKVVIA